MIKPHFLLLALTVLSCNPTETPSEAASPAVEPSAPMVSVDLAGNDMPLVVELGDAATLGVDAPSTVWNENTGRAEVKAGDHFGILISEEPGDLARLKADLERDALRTHRIIVESPEHVVYRSQFPDDALVFVHFYRIIKTEGREFVVQDDPAGRYNEADIERMARAVRTQRPV
jgi:hypothetical protein